MNKDITAIGMDLGTFKTSVVSSNGRREAIYSTVGWPKDHVARTAVGQDVVYGEDVWEHRPALKVVRPFEKGVLKYNSHNSLGVSEEQAELHKEAAKLLLEHAVAMTSPNKETPLYGIIGAPSRATVVNKQVLIEAAEQTLDRVMVISEPFAVAYGMGRLTNCLVADIGAGTIDICPMYGTYPSPDDQVTVAIGGDAVDEAFANQMQAACPQAQLSANMIREIKERYGFVHNVNQRAVVTLPTGGKPEKFDITEPLKEACRTLVSPLIDGLRQVVERVDPEFRQAMLNNIILSGGGSQLKGLDLLVEEALEELGGGKVTKVYDSMFAGADGALKLAMSIPREEWNRIDRLDHNRGRASSEPAEFHEEGTGEQAAA